MNKREMLTKKLEILDKAIKKNDIDKMLLQEQKYVKDINEQKLISNNEKLRTHKK